MACLADAYGARLPICRGRRHRKDLSRKPDTIVKWARSPPAIVDCFGIMSDDATELKS